MIETGNFRSSDATQLFFRAPLPRGTGIPVVVCHGFAEHSGRYDEILVKLAEIGFAPMAFDFRGHGHSEGKRGYIDGFQDYVNDLKAAVEFANHSKKEQPVILLAHSMGSLVAAQFAVQEPERVRGLVLSSPLFGIRMAVPGWKKELGHWMSKIWPSFGLPNEINADELTHDKIKAEDYRSDPMIFHHVTARWFEEIQRETDNSLDLAVKMEQPYLLQLSGDDRIVSYEKSCEWFEKSLSHDKSLKVYSGFFHEIYNELDRSLPIADFISWMLARWPVVESKGRLD